MTFWDKLRGELIDIIEWLDDTRDTMVWRFPRYENEIKNGAKLVVREGQVAVFVNEGQIADAYPPGTHTLTTENMPILSTLKGWKYGFSSPFKAEVYFVSTRVFTGNKWGTKNPIMLRDPEFGPVRMRAFGTYTIRVADPKAFLRNVVGTDRRLTLEEIDTQLRDLTVARFADVLGESKLSALDVAGKSDELSKFVTDRIKADFATYGLEIVQFFVENVSLPPEVEQAIDKRSSMGVLGNMQTYRDYQVANAIPEAAKNPGGLGAIGASIGMGAAMAGQVAGAMNAPSGGPPPLPQETMFHVAVGGKEAGPFNLATLEQQIAARQITPDTLVWRPGMTNWVKAGEVAEFRQLLASVPPPLPPQ